MGFYIQDGLWDAAQRMKRGEQDKLFGAIVRRFFAETDESESLPDNAYGVYVSWADRTDRAREEAQRKRTSRAGQKTDKSRTKRGQVAQPSKKERERESEKNNPGSDSDLPGYPPPYRGGGISGGESHEENQPATPIQIEAPLDAEQVAALLQEARAVMS